MTPDMVYVPINFITTIWLIFDKLFITILYTKSYMTPDMVYVPINFITTLYISAIQSHIRFYKEYCPK